MTKVSNWLGAGYTALIFGSSLLTRYDVFLLKTFVDKKKTTTLYPNLFERNVIIRKCQKKTCAYISIHNMVTSIRFFSEYRNNKCLFLIKTETKKDIYKYRNINRA